MADGGIGLVSLVLAVPGLIDLCIQYGGFMKLKIRSYKEAEEIARLDRFIVDLIEGELHILLQFFHSITGQMTPGFRSEVYRLFQVLRDQLEDVQRLFPQDNPGTRSKLGFSIHGKRLIDKACGELENWSERFFRRAVVFLFFGGFGDSAATQTVEKHSVAISRLKRIREAVTYTPATTLRLENFGKEAKFKRLGDSNIYDVNNGKELVEYRAYDPSNSKEEINTLCESVRDFVKRLHHAEVSSMGLLTSTGFSSEPLDCRFALRLQYPPGATNPCTLQQLLTDRINVDVGVQHSISDRIKLARKLASAVLYIHAANFVHKNIRPTNVLIFDLADARGAGGGTATYPAVIGEPYLVGFDGVRKADSHTKLLHEKDWEKNLYLHPARHDMATGSKFTMRHDIYSLGVVLLEIALWTSFTDLSQPVGRSLFVSVKNKKLRKPEGPEVIRDGMKEPAGLKERYLYLANKYIPRYLGDRYRDVLVSCLEGLKDEEQGGFLSDEDGIVVGSAYISQIIGRLEEIYI